MLSKCLLLLTMKPRGFFHICHHQHDRDNHEMWYKIFPKLRQTVSLTGPSLTQENLKFEVSLQCKWLRAAKEQMLRLIKFVTLGKKLLTSLFSDA